MPNEIIVNGIIYKLESVWKKSKNDNSKDIRGNPYQYPVIGKKWSGQKQFIIRLDEIQTYLEQVDNKELTNLKKCKNCLLCSDTCIITKRYKLDNYIWDDGLMHYITKHNIKPSDEFIDKIFKYDIKSENIPLKLIGRIKLKNEITYLKLSKNQIMIIDALMKHGGYSKKYYDVKNNSVLRYSEHAGFFDINEKNIDKIIVSGNTLRIDRGDEEIFLPGKMPEAYTYEYIFHTHPPTPKPGGRASNGVLYEFPSIGDILYFIDHYNDGNTVGSLVMTSEGLYNIRKLENDLKKIKIDEDKFYDDVKKNFRTIQHNAIDKYGVIFTTKIFYSIIAQDISFIEMLNNVLAKYHITIDFYPRVKDFRGSWIVDTVYVPINK